MSGFAVVDSSVAMKWLKQESEEHVAEAFDLLAEHEEGLLTLAAPTHLLLEVANALWSHHASTEQIQRALDLLMGLRLHLVPPDEGLLARASVLAVEHRITIYDALFAALAEQLGCELITEDAALAASGACPARQLG